MTNRIVIDFHGVLTDGKLNISHDGKTFFESVHVRDTRAMRELIALGYEVYIVTQSDSPIIDAYCEKVGCLKLVLRDKSKIPFISLVAIGDDVADLKMMAQADWAFCPSDADPMVRQQADITLTKKGGKGVIAEFITVLHEMINDGRILPTENERQQAR